LSQATVWLFGCREGLGSFVSGVAPNSSVLYLFWYGLSLSKFNWLKSDGMGLSERIAELEKLKSEGRISDDEYKMLVSSAVKNDTEKMSSATKPEVEPKIEAPNDAPKHNLEYEVFMQKSKKIGIAVSAVAAAIFIIVVVVIQSNNEAPRNMAPITSISEPTWVTKSPGDIVVAPFAQAVCDVIRDMKDPSKSSAATLFSLSYPTSRLNDVLSVHSGSYGPIAGYAKLVNDPGLWGSREFKDIKNQANSSCEGFGFTSENSSFAKKALNASDLLPVASTVASTVAASASDSEPTWVITIPEDVFVAPFAQAVCDILRTWQPPKATTSEEVSLLKKATSSLGDMVLSGQSETYLDIYVKASASLEYERKYPNDEVFPFSYSSSESICGNLGLTAQNSKFGIDPLTGNYKGE
jgi:hypothetical protein